MRVGKAGTHLAVGSGVGCLHAIVHVDTDLALAGDSGDRGLRAG